MRIEHSRELSGADLDQAVDGAELLSAASVRAYNTAWLSFAAWCGTAGQIALPAGPMTIVQYLDAASATRKPATLARHLAAISHKHESAGHESPTRSSAVSRKMRILRRQLGTAKAQKAALLTEEVLEAVRLLPDTLTGRRNRAILLLGFAGAFRRSEIIALHTSDLHIARQGMVVTLRRSKTDQEGRGRIIPIPYGRGDELSCPIKVVQAWKEAAQVDHASLFRAVNQHGQVASVAAGADLVNRVVKEAATILGLDPTLYGAHSLRAGLVTSAYLGGADERTIMRQTGHIKRETLEMYIRDAEIWRKNAATFAGL